MDKPSNQKPQLIRLEDLLPKANVKGSGSGGVIFGAERKQRDQSTNK
jgi:hypothetical protein